MHSSMESVNLSVQVVVVPYSNQSCNSMSLCVCVCVSVKTSQYLRKMRSLMLCCLSNVVYQNIHFRTSKDLHPMILVLTMFPPTPPPPHARLTSNVINLCSQECE